MKPVDYAVDRQRWAKMSIFEQMGNIGSEVGRSMNARRQNRPQDLEAAIARALDLFDATIEALVKSKSARAKEVLRSKEQFMQSIRDERATPEELRGIERYFTQYAIAARLSR